MKEGECRRESERESGRGTWQFPNFGVPKVGPRVQVESYLVSRPRV